MELSFDAHGLTVLEAKKQLERLIASADQHVTSIRVIHGFQHGDAIRAMVRDPKELRSKRLVRRKLTMNHGETILIIQPK